MGRLKFILIFTLLTLQMLINSSCSGNEMLAEGGESNTDSRQYPVYIVNNNLHTGIVIPVNSESSQIVSALKYFTSFQFVDIGWGEEKFYQDPDDNFCMGARAILLPNTSVLRVEGCSTFAEGVISWSDYTVKFNLSQDQYIKMLTFIEQSFTKGEDNELLITSKKHSGEIIFFKSVYSYHLFNTCNTWVAEALQFAGLKVSPFFIITDTQLYNEIKDQGTVLKSLK
jgi:uncharacterized protein (TIGR02117 family)